MNISLKKGKKENLHQLIGKNQNKLEKWVYLTSNYPSKRLYPKNSLKKKEKAKLIFTKFNPKCRKIIYKSWRKTEEPALCIS